MVTLSVLAEVAEEEEAVVKDTEEEVAASKVLLVTVQYSVSTMSPSTSNSGDCRCSDG